MSQHVAGPCTRTNRNHFFDNIRFILIFLVVLGHFLEIYPAFKGRAEIHQIIYTFHMPAFIFLFGYFAKFSPQRIVFRWAIPYFVWQSLYLLFAKTVLGSTASWQYTTPYWLLWYLLACLFYQLLIPLYNVNSKVGQAVVLGICIALALLAGFDKTIGYYLSLSRFFVFQPWFVLGLYCRERGVLKKLWVTKWQTPIIILSTAVVCLWMAVLPLLKLPNNLLYGSYSYVSIDCHLWMRAATMLMALSWLLFLFVAMKPLLNRHIPCITAIGQNSLPIFLLHGFIVRAVPVHLPELRRSVWYILPLTCAVLLLFGNRLCKKAVETVSLSPLERFVK